MNKNKKQVSQSIITILGSVRTLQKVFCAAFFLVAFVGLGFAQSASVTQNFVAYPTGTPAANYQCAIPICSSFGAQATCIAAGCTWSGSVCSGSVIPSWGDSTDRSFYQTTLTNGNGATSVDPWVNSALIEYDNPSSNPGTGTSRAYPGGCLTFCGEVTCSNPIRKVLGPEGTSVFKENSGPFPIQSVFFEVFKYQKNSNPMNPDSTPPVRTIALYPTDDSTRTCPGVAAVEAKKSTDQKTISCCDRCAWASASCQTKGQCSLYSTEDACNGITGTYGGVTGAQLCVWTGSTCADNISCSGLTESVCSDGGGAGKVCQWYIPSEANVPSECKETCKNFKNFTDCDQGTYKLSFCAAWDGMYEIDGEFGKSNGQFGFRTTIQSKWPGDGVQTPEIDINHMIAYPGMNQVPIQVDVTNVHSVRSSATLIGAKVAVATQPYNISYRLSKDALTTMSIKDPNTNTVLRSLMINDPALGEGTPGGSDKIDTVTTNVEKFNGRNDNGQLLPWGNYNIVISAKSQDEWTGTANWDQSREVIRQISMDPLKITDLTPTGLNKTSTAYAMLSYLVTEASTVYFEVYSPGTVFDSMNTIADNTTSVTVDGTGPTISGNSGTLIQRIVEQKQGQVTVNTKWDGICREDTCTVAGKDYTKGSPLPDGDYVYVIWAEIPYPDGVTVPVNGITWSGVKTKMYYNGILPINRGLPEISVQPVGYGTIGSSPTAFGLDPFIFGYSLSRDSIVSAKILTSAADSNNNQVTGAPFLVKTLLDNQIQISNKMNNYTWDGKDDNGRYVSPGNYIFEVTAKDSLFPDKQVTATVQFPVDIFRVVDVESTPILGEATSQATVNYALSKSMDVTLNIYTKDVVIPNPNDAATWPPVPCTNAGLAAVKPTCMYKMDNGNRVILDGSELLKTYAGQRPGDGMVVTESWDGLLYSQGSGISQDVMEDGMYPYYISAVGNVPASIYYVKDTSGNMVPQDPSAAGGQGFKDSLPATDRPSGYITIARGPVYFMNIAINPSKPELFYSSETVFIPTYEVQFAVTRTANVTVEIRSLTDGACLGTNTPAGSVCRTLTRTAAASLGTIYDPIVINKLYWDGKDEKGNYVATDAYEVRFTATPYPLPNGVNSATVCDNTADAKYCTQQRQILNVNNFQVFDRYIWDVSPSTKGMGKFAYQVSVPMKVAIQVFKPGTKIKDVNQGTLTDPANPNATVGEANVKEVLVKAIVGVRPHLVALEDVWDGTDYAGNKVPDGAYPFRFVTVLDSYDMNSITGSIEAPDQASVQSKVADWDKFINLGVINVANGDSMFADVDWKSNQVTSFFPNPLRKPFGQFEITKIPAPGTVTIKIYNIAGDLVRDSGYECINARGVTATLEYINNTGGLLPDWTASGPDTGNGSIVGGRNFTLRCKWDRTNNHGKQVARGLYYAIMELTPTMGNAKKSQKVVKILIP